MGTLKRFRTREDLRTVPLTSLFGAAPLIAGESQEEHDELRRRIASAFQPADAIEEISVESIATHLRDAARWRRSRSAFVAAQLPGQFLALLRPQFNTSEKRDKLGFQYVETMIAAWARGEPVALERVDGLLAELGLGIGEIADSVPIKDLDNLAILTQIDRQIANSEARWESDLEMLARHRHRREHSRQWVNEVRGMIESSASILQNAPRESKE